MPVFSFMDVTKLLGNFASELTIKFARTIPDFSFSFRDVMKLFGSCPSELTSKFVRTISVFSFRDVMELFGSCASAVTSKFTCWHSDHWFGFVLSLN